MPVSAQQTVQFFYHLQPTTTVDTLQEQMDELIAQKLMPHILLHPEARYNFQTLQVLEQYYQTGIRFAVTKTTLSAEELLFSPPKIARFPFEFYVDFENGIVEPQMSETQTIVHMSDQIGASIQLPKQETGVTYVIIEPDTFNRSIIQFVQNSYTPLATVPVQFHYLEPVSRYEGIENLAWSIILLFAIGIVAVTVVIMSARIMTARKFGGENDRY
ncbi:MAG: hypothetical protein ACRCWD_01345 [Culicoidibacterales bacterium]